PHPLLPPSFPTRRSSDLERFHDHPSAVFLESAADVRGSAGGIAHIVQAIKKGDEIVVLARIILRFGNFKTNPIAHAGVFRALLRDRKSTRLNSSHVSISY